MITFIENTLGLALLSAPWLLFGLIAAGLLRAWLPMDMVGKLLGGSGPMAVTRAALIGAPLPLCSCGTLPAAFALHRSGASRASTTSFLIATPETGVDSVALSWVLLGPLLAIIRPVAAIISAITAGLLVGCTENSQVTQSASAESHCNTSCCSSNSATQNTQQKPLWQRTLSGLHYAFSDLLDDLSLWLAVGMLAAGLVVTLVPPAALADWGSGLATMLLIMLISVPMYVCATASTPLAHAMLFAGMSPGTVLVFLLAGPASNLAGIILVKKELGQQALIAYLIGVGGISILLGLLLDATWLYLELPAPAETLQTTITEEPILTPLTLISLLLLLIMAIKPVRHLILHKRSS